MLAKQDGQMNDERSSRQGTLTRLVAPSGVPFSFTVTLVGDEATGISFEVTGIDPVTALRKTRQYQARTREHNSYTDFFESLAQDFGLRHPQNRRPIAKPTSTAVYHPILTENLVPDIIYGYGDPAVLRTQGAVGVK